MYVDQPIFMTENRKAAKRLNNKSSSSTWNFNSGGEGVDNFGTKSGGSALWNEGEGFLEIIKKLFPKKSKFGTNLEAGPITYFYLKIGEVG